MKFVKDSIDIDRYMQPQAEGDDVRPASDWVEEVVARVNAGGVATRYGSKLGWSKTHELLRFVPKGVTLWLGINGHGKSLITSQVQLDLMFAGEPCGLASLEMDPVETLMRMTNQAYAASNFGEAFVRDFHSWTDGRFWIYDRHGHVEWHRVIACGRFMAAQGAKHFFVDSLMKCVHGEDDYNGQKAFVAALCDLGKETGMHCHLIHHSKKLDDEGKMPGKFDAKGTGAITDLVDNVLTPWRNKAKEQARNNGDLWKAEDPDVVLGCDKQRHNGGWEGKIALWYHADSAQYLARPYDEPRAYFDVSQRGEVL